MIALPSLPVIEPWPLAARLACAPNDMPWTLVATPKGRSEELARAFADELEGLLPGVVVAAMASPRDLIALAEGHRTKPLVVHGPETVDGDAWAEVDFARSRLEREAPAILVVDQEQLPSIVERAPNFWSWLGGSVWRGVLEGEGGELTPT